MINGGRFDAKNIVMFGTMHGENDYSKYLYSMDLINQDTIKPYRLSVKRDLVKTCTSLNTNKIAA